MKKLVFATLIAGLATLASCSGDKKTNADNALGANDSLNKVIEQKENEINDMM